MSRYPLLLVLISLISGILVAGFLPVEKPDALWFALVFFGFLTVVLVLKSARIFWIYALLFFGGGFALTQWQDARFVDNHYARLSDSTNKTFLAKAVASPVPTKRAMRLELKLLVKEKREEISGDVYLYVPKDSVLKDILPGDLILFKARLNDITPPLNPHEFDYRNYLHLHQIYQQGYTTDLKIVATGANSIRRITSRIRIKLLSYINQLQLREEESAIASALLVGYRHLITDETTQNFAGAGAMHVLAVSGLHVGILYIITAFFLGINRKKPHRNSSYKVLLVVAIIWLYALITGLSPSVTRASVMFTFIAFGNLYGRKSATIQAIIASAIFMLLLKPNYLFEVGFQLSYAAVVGIVLIQPRLYNLFPRSRFKIINLGLQITAVSIAAQLSTFALSLYYFHQFPLWFIVSNLFVIPLAYGLMCYGIFLLAFSVFASPPALLILPFKGLMWLMLTGIEWVNQLPGALITGLWVNRFELVCFTLLSFTIAEVYFNRNKRAAFASMFAGIALAISSIFSSIQHQHDDGITIYSVPNTPVVEVHQKQNSYLIAPLSFLKDDDAMLFYVKHNIWAKGRINLIPIDITKDTSTIDFTLLNGVLETRNTRLIIQNGILDTSLFRLKPDVVFIQKQPEWHAKSDIPFQVVAQRNSTTTRQVRTTEYNHVYDLGTQGAFFIPSK